MAEEPKIPREILEKTIERVESTASTLKQLVQDNISRSTSPTSVSMTITLRQVESIASRLELDAMEAREALIVWDGVAERLGRARLLDETVDLSPERDVSPDACLPFDYDSEEEYVNHSTKWFEDEGYGYDSDRSPKYCR